MFVVKLYHLDTYSMHVAYSKSDVDFFVRTYSKTRPGGNVWKITCLNDNEELTLWSKPHD